MPAGVPLVPRQILPACMFRDMLVLDMNRLLSDYITHYRPMMRSHHKDIYSVGMQRRFARLARKNKVLLAVDPDPVARTEKRDILGWIMFKRWEDSALIVHYIYVRMAYREQGLARALLAAAGWQPGMPIIASHKFRLNRRKCKAYKIEPNEFILEELIEWEP